ncbi:prestin-like isoform X2 [Cherax quadricarinatus]|uniref:prestin-like isoform X2 n=1 Tax=Cherax quadricarinatus TaxID=27406 RepID=UPI00387E928B
MGHSEIQGGGCEVCVVRPTLSITQRASKYHYTPQHTPGFFKSLQIKATESCSCSARCIMSVVAARVPILSWLPSYNLRSSLVGDIVSGITVAIMHIPQGMGFAILAELPPIIGIYMAFFPVLIYALLGTSRHSSMGAFAIICLMTGKVVKQLAVIPDPESHHDGNETQPLLQGTHTYTPVQVAALVALMNGIFQIAMGVLQLGRLSVFLSDMLVSGFTTGAAVHVLTSQIPFILGIHVHSFEGPLKIIYAYVDIIGQAFSCDQAVMIISLITMIVLIFNNEYVKPWFRTFTKIPIPIELIVIISGTLTSYLDNFHDVYNIRIVGEVPTGLPKPAIPPVELMSAVLVDSVVISVVAYVVSFSMARIFAKRHNYNVDANQELYAMGASNVFGSFFGCAPIAVSLARSLIQEAAGGVTQITSFVCCFLLLFVLLFIGPVFETLPNGVEYLVVEMSGVSYTDSSGGYLLSQLYKEYQKAGITVCLAALSGSVLQTLDACGTDNVIPPEDIFHSLHDAVVALTNPDQPLGVDDISTQL